MNILLVGGTFNENGALGTESDITDKIVAGIKVNKAYQENFDTLDYINGGKESQIPAIMNLARTGDYDIIFWFPKSDNELIKIQDIKTMIPKAMLVVMENNDDGYDFHISVQKALAVKANLVFEFSSEGIMVFDPLGCTWYQGTDISEAANVALNRLYYLASITRQNTTQITNDKSLVLSWYFDQFKQDMLESDKSIAIPNEDEFVSLVHDYADKFRELMGPVKMSTSMPPQVGRCSKGMPSFKSGNNVFVSRRNVLYDYLAIEDFIPVYLENDKLYYCGEDKPSVDTPVHVRLYEALPNIRYILHSHNYIEDAPFTGKSIPCGAIEEVDEILKMIDRFSDRMKTRYRINLLGHGSIMLGATLDDLRGANYIRRPMPEKI